jgi:hypothetical protein
MTREQAVDILRSANALTCQKELLRLQLRKQQELYPAFQSDVHHGHPPPTVATIKRLLDAFWDPWVVSSWWLSPSGSLAQGQSPADLVGLDDAHADALLVRFCSRVASRSQPPGR